MKLNVFTPAVCGRKVVAKGPQISISNSLFRLSPVLVDLLELTVKDKIVLCQDADKPKDWYLAKSTDGFDLRGYKEGDKALQFSSATLHEKVKKAFPDYEGVMRIPIGTESVKVGDVSYFPLITNVLKKAAY